MLTHLSIKNYALIENLAVEFEDDLSIITGETGAGKSILLGALGLVLGKRADSSTLKNSEEKCVIEAIFRIKNYSLEAFFEQYDIDFENETIIRREILPNGKSRAFINDTPTTLQILQDLSEKLIDIHSQHQTLELSDTNYQFQIIDAIAQNNSKVESYQRGLKLFLNLKKELAKLINNQEKAKETFEYNSFLYDELVNANLEENEQEIVEQELDKLNNIEEIKISLTEAKAIALNDEVGIQSLLSIIATNLYKIAPFSKDYNELYERLQSVKIEFNDIVNELEIAEENLNFDASELEKLNARLQLIYNLQKKHNVLSISELLIIQQNLAVEIDNVENSSENIKAKQLEVQTIEEKINKLSQTIFEERSKAIPILTKQLEGILSNLGMENTRFKFVFSHSDQFYANGKDNLQLLISANKGVNFGELKKIASGGELSRIMLTIKAILSNYSKLPTIIFDEIDSGVSGEISQKMADVMQSMSKNMQVITITHLPQIAAKGKHHYKVFKEDVENNIVTKLKRLSAKERIDEIAEMLGGKEITSTAIEHAKQLLN